MKLQNILASMLILALMTSCATGGKWKDASSPPPEEMTLNDEEEYRLGRDVAAEILAKHRPVTTTFNGYATQMAQYLSQFSIRPSTFKGYRVNLIQSDQKAAFSAPGGFIFISTPLLDSLANEDELAGVIAHEIAHIALRHGELAADQGFDAEKQVKNTSGILGFMSSAFGLASKATKKSGGNSKANEILEKSASASQKAELLYKNGVGKIHEKILKTGYSRNQETGADAMAVDILLKAGYDPKRFSYFLGREFSSAKKAYGKGLKGLVEGSMLSTHPLDDKRVEAIKTRSDPWEPGPHVQARERRLTHYRTQTRT
jgi:predicted Zn-dependent protease